MWQECIINCGPSFQQVKTIHCTCTILDISFSTLGPEVLKFLWIAINGFVGLGSATTSLCLEWGTGLVIVSTFGLFS